MPFHYYYWFYFDDLFVLFGKKLRMHLIRLQNIFSPDENHLLCTTNCHHSRDISNAYFLDPYQKKNKRDTLCGREKRKEKQNVVRQMFCVNRKKCRFKYSEKIASIHFIFCMLFIHSRIRSFFRIPRETENRLLKHIFTIHHCRFFH